MSFPQTYKSELLKALDSIDLDGVGQAIQALSEARARGKCIFLCGNGGSASTASHFATDLLKGASYGRDKRFRVLALTDSLPTITAYSNDVAYEAVFVEQLKNFAQPDDVVIAFSGSGNSPNVVRAVEYANSIGCKTIGVTGRDGGKLAPLSHIHIHVAHPHMGRIEDAHVVIMHMIGYYFMEQAYPGE